LVRTFRSCTLY